MEPVHGNATPQDHFEVQANATSPQKSSPPSQNPFEYPSDTTNKTSAGAGVPLDQGNVSVFPARTLSGTQNSFSNNTLGLQSLLSPSVSESSSGNPFQEPTDTISKTFEDHHHNGPLQHEWHVTVPAEKQGHEITHSGNTLGETHLSSSHQTFPAAEQGHENVVNSNLRADSVAVLGAADGSNPDKNWGSSLPSFTQSSEFSRQDPIHVPVSADTNAIPMRESGAGFGEESSDDDIPISSMPKHGDGGGHNSAVVAGENWELGTNNGSEIQNPPTQVMERPGDPASTYRIPSHVFARNKSNTPGEWSTASNESLFSIHMGNMSFSKELNWLKSGELGYPGDTNMPGPLDALPSNPPPANPNPPAGASPNPPAVVNPNPPTVANLAPLNKLNGISPRTDDHDDSPGVTEAKAAETMREVIRENTENISKRDLSFGEGASRSNRLSHQSDGSTKSFVFPILAGDGNKSPSSKGVEEKPNQQKKSEPQNPKETPNAAQPQATKSTKSSFQDRWLSCFTCCTFCH